MSSFEWNDSLILGLSATISGVLLACFSMLLKSRCRDIRLGCFRIDCMPPPIKAATTDATINEPLSVNVP